MRPNCYSDGSRLAFLTQQQIQAAWGRGEHCGVRIKLINEAFRLYYRYRRRIEAVARRDWDTYWAMLRELEDAGDAGWGPGVQDLDDAFDHLIRHDGQWTDGSTRAYWGLNEPSVYREQVLDAPAAAGNFLTALNGKLEKLQGLVADYRAAAQAVLDPDLKLRKLRDIGRRAGALAWLGAAPETEPGDPQSLYETVIEGCNWLNKAVEYLEAMGIEFRRSVKAVVQVTDWLTRADQTAQAFLAARQAGLPERIARTWSALAFAVTYVPVLGDFWGQIVSQAPGLASWMRRTMQERHGRLERAAAGARF